MIGVSYIACYITPVLSLHGSILGRFLARFLVSVCAVIGPALLAATLQRLCSPLASVSNAKLALINLSRFKSLGDVELFGSIFQLCSSILIFFHMLLYEASSGCE